MHLYRQVIYRRCLCDVFEFEYSNYIYNFCSKQNIQIFLWRKWALYMYMLWFSYWKHWMTRLTSEIESYHAVELATTIATGTSKQHIFVVFSIRTILLFCSLFDIIRAIVGWNHWKNFARAQPIELNVCFCVHYTFFCSTCTVSGSLYQFSNLLRARRFCSSNSFKNNICLLF